MSPCTLSVAISIFKIVQYLMKLSKKLGGLVNNRVSIEQEVS